LLRLPMTMSNNDLTFFGFYCNIEMLGDRNDVYIKQTNLNNYIMVKSSLKRCNIAKCSVIIILYCRLYILIKTFRWIFSDHNVMIQWLLYSNIGAYLPTLLKDFNRIYISVSTFYMFQLPTNTFYGFVCSKIIIL